MSTLKVNTIAPFSGTSLSLSAQSVTLSSGAALTGSFSGSFQGDGTNLTGITAEWDGTHSGDARITGSLTVSGSAGKKADFTGLNAGVSGSFSGSFAGDGTNITGVTAEWDGTHSGNTQITGSLVLSGSGGTNLNILGNITASGNISSSGTITATTFSGSAFSGSTYYGDGSNLTGVSAGYWSGSAASPKATGDVQITGSLKTSGSIEHVVKMQNGGTWSSDKFLISTQVDDGGEFAGKMDVFAVTGSGWGSNGPIHLRIGNFDGIGIAETPRMLLERCILVFDSNSSISSSMIPGASNIFDFGTTSYRWKTLYSVTGSFTGPITTTQKISATTISSSGELSGNNITSGTGLVDFRNAVGISGSEFSGSTYYGDGSNLTGVSGGLWSGSAASPKATGNVVISGSLKTTGSLVQHRLGQTYTTVANAPGIFKIIHDQNDGEEFIGETTVFQVSASNGTTIIGMGMVAGTLDGAVLPDKGGYNGDYELDLRTITLKLNGPLGSNVTKYTSFSGSILPYGAYVHDIGSTALPWKQLFLRNADGSQNALTITGSTNVQNITSSGLTIQGNNTTASFHVSSSITHVKLENLPTSYTQASAIGSGSLFKSSSNGAGGFVLCCT